MISPVQAKSPLSVVQSRDLSCTCFPHSASLLKELDSIFSTREETRLSVSLALCPASTVLIWCGCLTFYLLLDPSCTHTCSSYFFLCKWITSLKIQPALPWLEHETLQATEQMFKYDKRQWFLRDICLALKSPWLRFFTQQEPEKYSLKKYFPGMFRPESFILEPAGRNLWWSLFEFPTFTIYSYLVLP